MSSNKPTGGDEVSGAIGGLPFHLTEKILQCISPLESAPLACVCKSWAATISERRAKPIPCMLFAHEVLDVDKNSINFLRQPNMERCRGGIFSVPMDEDSPSPVIPARLPVMVDMGKNMKLCGALPCGGLSFTDKNQIYLVNPVIGGFQILCGFAPQDTVRATVGANAFFVSNHVERSVSLRCREGEWSEWELLLPEEFAEGDAIDLVAYSRGVFYAMEFSGFTYSLDTHAPPPWRLTKLTVPSILEKYSPIRGRRYLRNSYLLESEGDVMFVGPVLAREEKTSISSFEVYKLDDKRARWVKVERLGDDLALFVSEQSLFAVRASNTPGCRHNCIYFVSEFERSYSPTTWGVYSMEHQKVLFEFPIGGCPGKYKAARWFFPVIGASPEQSSNHASSTRKRKIQML